MKTLTRPIGLTAMLVFGLSFTTNAKTLLEIYKALAPLTKSVQMNRVSNNQMTCLVVRPPIVSNDAISMEYYYCSKNSFTDYSGKKWFFGGKPVMFDEKSKLVISDRPWFGWIDLVYSEENRKEVEQLINLMKKQQGNEITFAQFLLDSGYFKK